MSNFRDSKTINNLQGMLSREYTIRKQNSIYILYAFYMHSIYILYLINHFFYMRTIYTHINNPPMTLFAFASAYCVSMLVKTMHFQCKALAVIYI
jgi:hypothetical protein